MLSSILYQTMHKLNAMEFVVSDSHEFQTYSKVDCQFQRFHDIYLFVASINTLTRLRSFAGMVCQPLLTLLLVGFLCSTPWTFGDEEVEADNGNIQKNNLIDTTAKATIS